MGQPTSLTGSRDLSYGGEPGEVKHLSTLRKRNQIRDFLSSGERTGNSPKVIVVLVEASGNMRRRG